MRSFGTPVRDLDIWQTLSRAEPSTPAADLLPALDSLASAGRKEPTILAINLGGVRSLCNHDDPQVRAGACRVLGGVEGIEGLRALIGALDDDAPEVREAAARGLAASFSAPKDPRWIHLLFHPRPDVRRLALRSSHGSVKAQGVYLRCDADPENAELARALPWPEGGFALALALFRSGHATAGEVVAQLARSKDELPRLLARGPGRSLEQAEALLGWLEGAGKDVGKAPEARPGQPVDAEAMAAAFGEDPHLESLALLLSAHPQPAALRALVQAIGPRTIDAAVQARLCAALVQVVLEHLGELEGEDAPPALVALLDVAVRLRPRLCLAQRLPAALLRSVARGLQPMPRAGQRARAKLVAKLVRSSLCRGPEGELLLDVALGLMCLGGRPSVVRLLELIPRAEVTRRLAQCPQPALGEWGYMCRLVETDEQAAELLKLCGRANAQRMAELRAIALAAWGTKVERTRLIIRGLGRAALRQLGEGLVSLAEAGVLPRLDKLSRCIHVFVKELEPATAAQLLQSRLRRLPLHTGEDDSPVIRTGEFELVHALFKVLPPPTLELLLSGLELDALSALGRCIASEDLPLLPSLVQSIANALTKREEEPARALSQELLLALAPPMPSTHRISTRSSVASLSSAEVEAIAMVMPADLERALGPALAGPSIGLAPALARRPDPALLTTPVPAMRVAACVALLGSHDSLTLIAEQFDRFWDAADSEFESAVVGAAVNTWQAARELGPLGHAWMHCWEQHAFAFGEWLRSFGSGGGSAKANPADSARFRAALERCASLPSPILRRRAWMAASRVVSLWATRDRGRGESKLEAVDDPELPAFLVAQLDTDLGPSAAQLLVSLHLARCCRAALDAQRPRVLASAVDYDQVTRHTLSRWVRIDGLPNRTVAARAERTPVRESLLGRVRITEDLELLRASVLDRNAILVNEAVLRLLTLGGRGEAVLAELLEATVPAEGSAPDEDAERSFPPRIDVLMDSVPLWEDLPALGRLRALVERPGIDAELRFRLSMAFAERGEFERVPAALEAARSPEGTSRNPGWFRASDWQALTQIAELDAIAHALVDSPHPHAYRLAVEHCVAKTDSSAVPALRRFLAVDSCRPSDLRRSAALTLLSKSDETGLPVLMAQACVAQRDRGVGWLRGLHPQLSGRVAETLVDAALIGGKSSCLESRALGVARACAGPEASESLRRLLLDGRDASVRPQLIRATSNFRERRLRMLDVAEMFAWGVRRGLELTGKLFSVHMTERREDFGYTRMNEARIYVSTLPYLAGARHGRQIVEALILHEFGHHMFHGGEAGEAVWKRAQAQGLHGVLNLVADEHLERNLRALRADYGDRLKRLGAHAFQHAEREFECNWLLTALGPAAFATLTTTELRPAFDPTSVRAHRGTLLRQLERSGSAWARFARALRLGLGNRHDDPRVAEALSLFTPSFRRLDMEGLWAITERLAELFAHELPTADLCGGHETLGSSEREAQVRGENIGDEDLQQEVERILDPRRQPESAAKRAGSDGPPRLAINVSGEVDFERITRVERLSPRPDEHRRVAAEVKRHANHLAQFFASMGAALVPKRGRMRGRSFDRGRLTAVVTRQDPRMLIAREPQITTDLFIGVVIDCSGSMRLRDHMDKAIRFGVLLAEAAAPVDNVDARFFGFTDQLIYDAGDARRCAVTSLETGGGNNDAAALAHVAKVAMASRRKAKLLVMISDGLPTECSVDALRGLVLHLTRRHGMICAQVAVRALEEVCFPHYVSLDAESVELATHRFGLLISKLARRALSG